MKTLSVVGALVLVVLAAASAESACTTIPEIPDAQILPAILHTSFERAFKAVAYEKVGQDLRKEHGKIYLGDNVVRVTVCGKETDTTWRELQDDIRFFCKTKSLPIFVHSPMPKKSVDGVEQAFGLLFKRL